MAPERSARALITIKYFNKEITNPTLYSNEPIGEKEMKFEKGLVREVNAKTYEGHSSDVITDISLEWLDQKRDKSKPFFLMHHFKAPHDFFEFASVTKTI